jgi:hypothetical protein
MTEREITRRVPKALTSNLFIPNYARIGFPVPCRTDAPWCPECGQTLPNHWAGCPSEHAFDAVGLECPGAVGAARGVAHPYQTGADAVNHTPREVP